jgi:hypothetical protein
MMLYLFLEIVFNVHPGVTVHFNSDLSVWSDDELKTSFNGDVCSGSDCDPFHFPTNNDSPFYFTKK